MVNVEISGNNNLVEPGKSGGTKLTHESMNRVFGGPILELIKDVLFSVLDECDVCRGSISGEVESLRAAVLDGSLEYEDDAIGNLTGYLDGNFTQTISQKINLLCDLLIDAKYDSEELGTVICADWLRKKLTEWISYDWREAYVDELSDYKAQKALQKNCPTTSSIAAQLAAGHAERHLAIREIYPLLAPSVNMAVPEEWIQEG